VVANGDPVVLPWQVALEDGDASGLFVFAFQAELTARIVGRLVVEALELELVDGGDIDPRSPRGARGARAALTRSRFSAARRRAPPPARRCGGRGR